MIDQLVQDIKSVFGTVKEHRYKNARIPLSEFLQHAFAMFHLKDPSLNQYREAYPEREGNLKRIYGVEFLPSDTAIREGIDGIAPSNLQQCFKVPLKVLEQQGIMEEYLVLGRYKSILFDGTQHYCSANTPCEHCLSRVHRNKKGEITKTTYSHQALAAVMADYEHKEVFPIACEAIVKQDGEQKNDCELNASKRLLPVVREMLPKAKHDLLGIFDGLYANGPHIKLLQSLHMRYIIGIRDGYVLVQVERLKEENNLHLKEWTTEAGVTCTAKWSNDLILNGEHQDMTTNYFEYTEVDATGKQLYYNTWISDIEVNEKNIEELIKVGRSRWKIENETFNTLKNQGYHLEHSYGHGEKYLATNLMLLTFMAFLVDQIAQKVDAAFDRAIKRYKTRKRFWEKVRQVFDFLPCMSMNVVYRFIAGEIKIDFPLLE